MAFISHAHLSMFKNLVFLIYLHSTGIITYEQFYSGVDFNLSLKIMLLSPAWYGKPHWKDLNNLSIANIASRHIQHRSK